MQPVGFSTGAIALGDFNRALAELAGHRLSAVELSALRDHELAPLMESVPALETAGRLRAYKYISVHAPSKFGTMSDSDVVALLRPAVERSWPVIVHPDVIRDFAVWRTIGPALCVENMDGRKPIGRTVAELEEIFERLPESTLCFDIGHAHQIDPTMGLARDLLQAFVPKLRQMHLSYVTPDFAHHRMTSEVATEYRKVARLIPDHVPVILESPVTAGEVAAEVSYIDSLLPPKRRVVA